MKTDNTSLEEQVATLIYGKGVQGGQIDPQENKAVQRVVALIQHSIDTAVIGELSELRVMAQTNYDKTENYDMKILANYCEYRIKQLEEKQ